ncbi:hypothetical protein IJH66_02800 [Candidatus Saccharibacteria bacterium]|nr:hypothetical protein [Candidatus Saccharibacteria bacterium]
MTEKNKLKTPEEVLGKPLNEMIEEDALTLALAFELDGISPERFWEQDNQSQHDYAQRILDFFQITAKKLVIGLFNPETEIATAALQVKMSKLKAKSPRPRPGIMKEHIKEFEILELAFELWLERSPQVANPDDIEQPIPKELLKQLFRRGTVPNRDIYSVTGNSTGRFKDAEIAVIDRFCPIRAITWQEFLKLPISVQKLYLTRVVNFFKTTWGDIAKYWFKGTVSTTTLEQVVKNLDIQRDQIICNRDIVKAIKQCAKREAFVRNNAEAPTPADNEAPAERTETSETENTAPAEETVEPEIANEPSTPPQNDSETNCPEGEAEESEAQEVPPVAESDATLLPTGEIILNRDLEPVNDSSTEPEPETHSEKVLVELPVRKTPDFGGIDTFYSLRAELPKSAFYEIEAILRRYEDAGAIHIIQSSRSHLDVASLEA